MPRSFSFKNRTTPEGQLAVISPQRTLAKVSTSASKPLAEYEPAAKKGHEWQVDAFRYNRDVPEVGALHAGTAELVGMCKLVAVDAEKTDKEGKPIVVTDPDVIGAMNALTGPIGGQRELQRSGAYIYQIAGEALFLATPLDARRGKKNGFMYEFLSPLEVRAQSEGYGENKKTVVYRNKNGMARPGDTGSEVSVSGATMSRFYRRDPEFSGRADSPMRRILPLCVELVTLGQAVTAIANSRLAAGALFVPDEMDFGPEDETVEGGRTGEEVFMDTVVEHMSAPKADPSSTASLAPLFITGPAEYGEKIRLIPLGGDLDKQFAPMRKDLLERIARGLDAPPEMMTGKSGLNHWSSFNVWSEFVDNNVAPIGQEMAEFLTIAYLRKALVEREGWTEERAETVKIHFDYSAIIKRSDEGAAANSGYQIGSISEEAWRKANGFSSDDAPEPEEKMHRLMEELVKVAPETYGKAFLPILYPDLADAVAKLPDPTPLEDRRGRSDRIVAPDAAPSGEAPPSDSSPTRGRRPRARPAGASSEIPEEWISDWASDPLSTPWDK